MTTQIAILGLPGIVLCNNRILRRYIWTRTLRDYHLRDSIGMKLPKRTPAFKAYSIHLTIFGRLIMRILSGPISLIYQRLVKNTRITKLPSILTATDKAICTPSKSILTTKWATTYLCTKRRRRLKIPQNLTWILRGPLRRSKRHPRIRTEVEAIKSNHRMSSRRSSKASSPLTRFTINKFWVSRDWDKWVNTTMVRRKLLLSKGSSWPQDSRITWSNSSRSSWWVILTMVSILLRELEVRAKNWFRCLCISTRTIRQINRELTPQTMD